MHYDFDKQKAKEDADKDGLYPYFEDDFNSLKKICGKILKYIAYLGGACIAIIMLLDSLLYDYPRPIGVVLFSKIVDAFSTTKPSYYDFFKIQSKAIVSFKKIKDEFFSDSFFDKTTKPTFKTWSRELLVIKHNLHHFSAKCEKFNESDKGHISLQTWIFYRYEDDIKSIIDISDENLDINLDMPLDEFVNVVANVINLLKKDKNYQNIITDANIAKYKIDVCLKKLYPNLNSLNHDTRLLVFGHIYATLKFTHDFGDTLMKEGKEYFSN